MDKTNRMEYNKISYPASLRWHYPNQVFGYNLSSFYRAPRAINKFLDITISAQDTYYSLLDQILVLLTSILF